MNDKPKYYITTPIYYPSAKLHIGHTYCTSIADSMARFKRLDGYDVFFLTGSDEHGQKIEQKAEEAGVTPIEYTDKIVGMFQQLWKELNISNDDFIRTTQKRHEKVVQMLFQRSYDKGDIYKGKYEGWYCVPCESFWPENKLDENHTCPDCGRPLQRVSEEAYFFKMSKYADRWMKYVEENPGFIQPESRRNEMIQFVKSGLEDLCVSRTSFSWGIKVPFDPKHVVYVWFDALVNYLTAAGIVDDPEKFKKFCDGLLMNAVAQFTECRQDLAYDDVARSFNADLSVLEVYILSRYWVIAWWERETNNAAQIALKLKVSSAFTFNSEAQNFKEKQNIIDKLREEVDRATQDYLLLDIAAYEF